MYEREKGGWLVYTSSYLRYLYCIDICHFCPAAFSTSLPAYEGKRRAKMAYVIAKSTPTLLAPTNQAVMYTLVNRLHICGRVSLNYGLLIFSQHQSVITTVQVFFFNYKGL